MLVADISDEADLAPGGVGPVFARIFLDLKQFIFNAQLFKVDETQAIYERITAPTLCVVARSDSIRQWWNDSYSLSEFMQRIQVIRHLTHATMDDVGHMLHHDQPEQLARLIEDFLGAHE